MAVNHGKVKVVFYAKKATVVLTGCCIVLLSGEAALSQPGLMLHARQVAPMHQESLKVPSPADMGRRPNADAAPSSSEGIMPQTDVPQSSVTMSVNGYDPSGRRDPFAPVVQQLAPGQVDLTLPPLQRVGLTDMNLIAVIWGAYGYTAMVQMPDGNGYAVRKGTRIGPNNGVVSAITEKGIVVQERFTDVYGRKQEREYVKLLHPKEASE
jgi:type IV pilus assembly protein PilP